MKYEKDKKKDKKQTCLNRVDGNTVSGLQCLSIAKVTAVDSKKTLNRKAKKKNKTKEKKNHSTIQRFHF